MFIADESLGEMSEPEKILWDALEQGFADSTDDVLVIWRYPIFGKTGVVSQIDILLAHREWGLLVFEIKPFLIQNIRKVGYKTWRFTPGTQRIQLNPHQQAMNHLYALFDSVARQLQFSDTIQGHAVLVFNGITSAQWQQKGFDNYLPVQSVIFSDNLASPKSLKSKLDVIGRNKDATLTDGQWQTLKEWLINNRRPIDTSSSKEEAIVDTETPSEELPDPAEHLEREVPSIFISYRRQDSAWAVRCLADYLHKAFEGKVSLFLDVDNLGFGQKFDDVLDAEVQKSNVIMVIIGPRWLTMAHENGMRRLDNPNDFVVREISTAFEVGKTVIPILLDDVAMPANDDLPEAISNLSLYHAFRMKASSFGDDVPRLEARLRELLRLPTPASEG